MPETSDETLPVMDALTGAVGPSGNDIISDTAAPVINAGVLVTSPDFVVGESLPVPAPSMLSKRQQKRLAKTEKMKEFRATKRKQERERRKQRIRELHMQGIRTSRKVVSLGSADASPIRVVLDLSFTSLMSEKDNKKTINQVKDCYAKNRHSCHPLQLFLTSMGNEAMKFFSHVAPGHASWDVHHTESSWIETFKQEEVVYLTADSPNVLTDLSASDVYIIGGIVDHNSNTGLCYKIALDRGVRHAQLPISQHVQLNSRRVLTINHVFHILLEYASSRDWKEALLRAIPLRKLAEGFGVIPVRPPSPRAD